MISSTKFIWFFSIRGTSYAFPIVLYNGKKVSHSNTCIESKNQNAKRRMETKNISYFCFWIKQSYRANSMKKATSMNKESNNLSKPHFGCYFCRSLVNFKNLIILFWNIWIIYGSWKSWRSNVFDLEHVKNNSEFAIPNRLIWFL